MILNRSMQCAVSTMCFWWMSNKRKQRGKKRCSEDILSSYSVNQIHMLTGSSEIRHSSQHLLTHRGLQWSLKTLTDEAFVWNLTPSKGITLFWCGSYKKTGYWLIRVYLRTNEQSNAEKVNRYTSSTEQMFTKTRNSWVGRRKAHGIYVRTDSVFFVYTKGWAPPDEEATSHAVFFVKMSLLALDEEVWIL